MTTTAAVYEVLQRRFGPGVNDQLNNKTEIRRLLKKDTDKRKFNGSFFQDAVKTGRPSTGRYTGEEEAIPSAGNSKIRNSTVHITRYWTKINVGKVLEARSQGGGAFVGAMVLEMEGATDQAMTFMERAICSAEPVLCTLTATSLTAVAANQIRVPLYDAVRLDEGMRIEAWRLIDDADGYADDTSTGTVKRSNPAANDWMTIDTIDLEFSATEAMVTFIENRPADWTIAAISATSREVIVCDEALILAGTQVLTREPIGIPGFISNKGQLFQTDSPSNVQARKTMLGILLSTNPKWKSPKFQVNGDLTPQAFEQGFTKLKVFSGRPTTGIKYAFCHTVQGELWRRARYTEEYVSLDANNGMEKAARGMPSSTDEKKYPTFGGIALVDSRYFNRSDVFLSDPKTMQYYQLSDFQMWKEGDNGFHKAYNNTPATEGEWYCFEQFGGTNRVGNLWMSDLTTS